MMTIKDYAQDVELEIEEIEALCDKIGIEYQDENTDLDETSIILLDNEVQEMEQNGDSEVVVSSIAKIVVLTQDSLEETVEVVN